MFILHTKNSKFVVNILSFFTFEILVIFVQLICLLFSLPETSPIIHLYFLVAFVRTVEIHFALCDVLWMNSIELSIHGFSFSAVTSSIELFNLIFKISIATFF
jgi:hypothetical protein